MEFNVNTIAEHLREGNKLGSEISITGKWVPQQKGGLFRKSKESIEMIEEWNAIHKEASSFEGILSTEINHAIGEEAVLVHHVFKNGEVLLQYFNTIAKKHSQDLFNIAKPQLHLIRGNSISAEITDMFDKMNIPFANGEYIYGYVKNDYNRPNPEKAIQVTAKWTVEDADDLNELKHWWSMVGRDAMEIEKGLVRFEAYQVNGENALIIHETFETNDQLQFHLTKGTAAKYKKNLDKIAQPENYFFRGPVSWLIRTYSKFMNLPATYTRAGSHYIVDNGNMSDGLK